MKTRTFRAADGTRVKYIESAEQRADRELLTMTAMIMPVLTILLFAIAGRMI